MTWQQIFVGILVILIAMGLTPDIMLLLFGPLLALYGIHVLTGLLETQHFVWYMVIALVGLVLLKGFYEFRVKMVKDVAKNMPKYPFDIQQRLRNSVTHILESKDPKDTSKGDKK